MTGIGSLKRCSPAYLCTGETGYDGPTGWGTPDGAANNIWLARAPGRDRRLPRTGAYTEPGILARPLRTVIP
jgi:hypothetical protein